MLDPRKDLQNDNMFWELVLTCATTYKDKQIFGNLHGLRCSGAHLYLKDNNLSFRFPTELDEKAKQNMKQKYVLKYITQFKELFKFVAEYYQKHIDELVLNKNDDYFTRDIFSDSNFIA